MDNSLLTDENLKKFIESLNLADEQSNFLINELPKMNTEERIELLDMLKNVYLLNKEENEKKEKIKNNWQNTE